MQPNFSTDEKLMNRCLQLASNSLGLVAPNPMVGSVIVHNGKIIGEGYHQKCGEAHAEVNAINSVKNQELLKESVLYVNLEPCSHWGKTPPCTNLIIEKQIPKVVIGCIDTFSKVNGDGINRLIKEGCEVVSGVLQNESRELNRRFFTFHEKKRPYIVLKWAQTADGFIDIERAPDAPSQPNWITDEVCRALVHQWRAEENSILVGTQTARFDNPRLNIRLWSGNNPLRLVIDRNLTLNSDLHIFDGNQPTLVFTSKQKENSQNLEYIVLDFNQNIIPQILYLLYQRNIQSLMIEGGAFTLQKMIDQEYWDEIRFFIGENLFLRGIKAPCFSVKSTINTRIGNSILHKIRRKTYP